jgi:hypothetical protein
LYCTGLLFSSRNQQCCFNDGISNDFRRVLLAVEDNCYYTSPIKITKVNFYTLQTAQAAPIIGIFCMKGAKTPEQKFHKYNRLLID